MMQSLKDEYILMRRYKVNRVTNLRGGFFKTMEKRSGVEQNQFGEHVIVMCVQNVE